MTHQLNCELKHSKTNLDVYNNQIYLPYTERGKEIRGGPKISLSTTCRAPLAAVGHGTGEDLGLQFALPAPTPPEKNAISPASLTFVA